MLGYAMVGTNDLQKAAAFYDGLLADLGAGRAMEMERCVFWATGPGAPMFSVTLPFDGQPATVGNGSMFALVATSSAQVDSVYAKAMSLGASDEGAPGPRGDGGFYAGYFRDLDGNKLCVFFLEG